MSHPLLLRAAFAVGTLTLAASALAQFNPDQRGPQPTLSGLEAGVGPFDISQAKVTSPSGFRAGTVHYPTRGDQGPFGLVVMTPGLLAGQSSYAWLSQRLASHGFVVVNFDVYTPLDFPEPRARQAAKALLQVAALSQKAVTPYFGRVDVRRQAVVGHSMGGAAALTVARDNPALKAAVALTPGGISHDFSGVQVPSLIVACGKDPIVPSAATEQFYASLLGSLPRAHVETMEGTHACPTSTAPVAIQNLVGRFTIAWLKRFVDADTRYTPFVRDVSDPGVLRFEQGGAY